jgi:hypothetical protein
MDHTARHTGSAHLPYAIGNFPSCAPCTLVPLTRVSACFFSQTSDTFRRHGLHHVECDKCLGEQMPRPTCRSWWGGGTRHHGHCGFNSAITLHGAALPGRLMEDRQEMLRPFVVILLAPGIDGDVRHPEDLGDVWICAAVVGQQSYPCASELAGAFLPPGDRSGQVFMFIWGEFDLNASPCQMRSFRREDAKENSKLKDFFERPLSRRTEIQGV